MGLILYSFSSKNRVSFHYMNQGQDFLDRTSKLVKDDVLRPILVNIDSSTSTSSVVKLSANKKTLTSNFCNELADTLGIQSNEAVYFSLILVLSRISDENSHHILHTLQQDEKIIETYDRIKGTYSIPDISSVAISSSKVLPRWYYKDIRTSPLELDGEISGDSSSDDESEISMSDLKYLVQADKRGYLLKRSSSDAHLWRRRLCVLTDKLWYIKARGEYPKAGSISFGNLTSEEFASNIKCHNGFLVQGTRKSTYFRASSDKERQSWVNEIRSRASFSSEDNVLVMGEMIITDEEDALARRMHRALHPVLTTCRSLGYVKNMRAASPKPGDNHHRSHNQLPNKWKTPQTRISPSSRYCGSFPCMSVPVVHTFPWQHLTHLTHSLDDDSNARNHRNNNNHSTINSNGTNGGSSSINTGRENGVERIGGNSREISFPSVLSFLIDVQKFKESFRQEMAVLPRHQWLTAVLLYEDHLEKYLPDAEFAPSLLSDANSLGSESQDAADSRQTGDVAGHCIDGGSSGALTNINSSAEVAVQGEESVPHSESYQGLTFEEPVADQSEASKGVTEVYVPSNLDVMIAKDNNSTPFLSPETKKEVPRAFLPENLSVPLLKLHQTLFGSVRRRTWEEVRSPAQSAADLTDGEPDPPTNNTNGSIKSSTDRQLQTAPSNVADSMPSIRSFSSFFTWKAQTSGTASSQGISSKDGLKPNGTHIASNSIAVIYSGASREYSRKSSKSTVSLEQSWLSNDISSANVRLSVLESEYEVIELNKRPSINLFDDIVSVLEDLPAS